ncbi:HlyD family type I secretion periplasmic adaptor subunit [Rhodobacter capsulatus]|uniref:Membrane fusion protein (MFP) family protein n=1 Tax=Rhodobacter capsulatus TaxID=1061 RepID=A0A0Q0ZWP8_RHOCA|nr:HlyD family type I secretion periplasmic adaptor subunit [Rhodobacter capsulatus]KQB11308.1 transporter [Rhodobacter capsulatus]KQB14153.1 transporter [Rhodobacter capsulatus]PZX22848.1 adhesin transport system membrane fusion protein [Rhodobacter capsulatus]QNR63434.1 HlyD family type I secretion periplasmic adaptor subunit [Rhodobacter capsulatus]WER09578.1 HlyD family type I secretion periplasmic adaptor subunit [Rhodobacter capsulatus]
MSTVDPAAVTTAARRMSWTIWLIGLSILAFLVWSAYARIDQIVRGPGEIVSSSKPQIIQNLEGGILAELNVSEGDEVSPGTVLGRLHETSYRTQVDDLQAQIAALEIRQLRLEAEMNGLDEFVPSEEQDRLVPEIVKSESALLLARLSDYASRRKGAAAILKQAKAERDMLEKMFERDVAPLIEVTKARKAFSDAEAQLNDITTKAELDRASDYSETLEKLGTLRQQLKLSQDQLTRTTLTSPMHGIVNKLSVTTIGGVVRPGEEILEIIPLDEELFIDARIAPKDIANVKLGQAATIKLSAYDYTIYGSLQGAVHFVSADTFKDEQKPDAEPYYKVTLRVDLARLTERQRRLEIRPGMQATVELHTGEKTVLQYLLKPLYKSREALREP